MKFVMRYLIIIVIIILIFGDYIPLSTITNRYDGMNLRVFFDMEAITVESIDYEILTNVEKLGFDNEWTDIYITSSYSYVYNPNATTPDNFEGFVYET
jgi:hypothetical protein